MKRAQGEVGAARDLPPVLSDRPDSPGRERSWSNIGALRLDLEPERIIDDEEGHVVQIGHTRGRVKATGREFDVPETHVWTVEGGKVTRYEAYIDTPKMREALGL